MLANRNKQRRYFNEMATSSIWARFANVADMDAPGSKLFDADMPKVIAARRLATNHFCGYGWWCWVIPLSDGQTSIGLVYDKRLFDPGLDEGGPRVAFERFLASQPGLRELVADAEMAEDDFNLRHRLAYTTDAYAGKGWAMVGDAATFLDPFYSPGLDHASFSVFATAKLIAKHLAATGGRRQDAAGHDASSSRLASRPAGAGDRPGWRPNNIDRRARRERFGSSARAVDQ